MSETESFVKVSVADLALKKGDVAPFDLYVFLHASGRHHSIVKRGEVIEETHWFNLLRLQDSNLFVKEEPVFLDWRAKRKARVEEVLASIKKPVFHGEVLGDEAKEKLQAIYAGLLTTPAAGKDICAALQEMSDSLLDLLVPEARDAKSSILQQLRHIHLMNHAAAISSLAMLTALANGFESRTAFSNLAFACLLMDAGLVDVSEKELLTYYKNRTELPSHVMDRIRLHPMKSAQMLQGMKDISEAVQQLVLLHQELHNGKGYHRGLRTGSVSPLARNLAFAADLYEHIKGAELRGEKLTLAQSIVLLSERGVQAHDRRHGADISTKLQEYLNLK
jgi:HD-GYP domain-containing protein (c-di-GMP phosphodiesterase class II)